MFAFVNSLTEPNYQTAIKLPSTASETYVEGEGLVVTTGALTKVGATVAPTYICAQAYVAPASGNLDIYAYPVLPSHVFKVAFSADASSNVEGTKVTIDSTGLLLTATATSGVATIVKKLGTGATGTYCLCRFI